MGTLTHVPEVDFVHINGAGSFYSNEPIKGNKISHFLSNYPNTVPEGRRLVWTFERRFSAYLGNQIANPKGVWRYGQIYMQATDTLGYFEDMTFMHNGTTQFASAYNTVGYNFIDDSTTGTTNGRLFWWMKWLNDDNNLFLGTIPENTSVNPLWLNAFNINANNQPYVHAGILTILETEM